jgi:hypothetical protein
VIFLLDITGLDFGYVSPSGVVPFLVSGGFGDGEVGFVVPGPGL